MSYHRLLIRQLKKSGIDINNHPDLLNFVNSVNDAYLDFNKDIHHIENILEKSSRELFVANQKLRCERDDTKLKLENIVGNIEGVIFETDLKGNFTFLNNAWEEYSGFTIEDSIGKNYKDFLKTSNIEGYKRLDELFSNKKEALKFIFKHEANENLKWFEVQFKLVKNPDRIPIGFIGSIFDITNIKETEIELNNASKAKDDFLSTMSHEIRTPLNAVTGLTNILLMEDHLPEQVENLKALKYSGEHLLGLINDLLDFNKIKSGKVKIAEKDFSLAYFLENIESHFKLRAKTKKLNFSIFKDDHVPNNIIGDKLKLTQVVKNLISNSIKFTENGSVILKVRNLGIKNNKVSLEFKVSDTGIGISSEKQKTIFENFMQADSETSVKYGGSGLGLAISKKLLNLQKSDLIVESKLGNGATFSFVITYKVSNRLNLFSPDMVEIQPNYEPLSINVLVAEDNKMNILILKRFFAKWKVKFKIAENGKELLKIYENEDFDLILMDLQMPIMNGYETTKIIRNLPDEGKSIIPIVALTAFAQTDIKEKTKRYKMNDFMGKPFDPKKLYNLLKSYGNDITNKQAI